ncbi:nicotinate-nucleotide adenylyltransferase [Pseudobacillus badius]|uniref:nicotinate-nucleotide adenylyltransferase n=1 Tax=Bacillus badius TaxID=1455 RepID=UPI0007B045A8|nr:nicotinate-nucleotide adenylyltransferase [Bacillus badius]KZN98765.1 nicotinic acid mononucleotide adenylyltransferase [Bacillus badius]MED0666727.1 nicotinate-nucleotide adenylyltransferase [Bacillus badius]OCS83703.1 nicotinic acid mononucleotide adenylyltransferase [Bacillus badius]OVE53010.1 nicotinic acid mononucleotide adenylyltransferase [Bacillus badius]TDW05052.1 nicotinate-nucleotide adenylyltransferase [Bacillus badius]
MKKKAGILGGTFNPPHLGHLMIANEVLEALQLDEVRFMPNYHPPHKEMDHRVTDEDRIHMLQAAIDGHPRFVLELIEMERKGTSYTFDTMKALQEQEPETEFYFIIGGDMIEYLPKWYKIAELSRMVTFAGVRRPGYSVETPYPVQLVDTPEIYLSSTMLRQRAASGGTLRYLLPEKVIAYIKENRLYEA